MAYTKTERVVLLTASGTPICYVPNYETMSVTEDDKRRVAVVLMSGSEVPGMGLIATTYWNGAPKLVRLLAVQEEE